MRILAVTGLYPRPNKPSHGIFIHQRLRALATAGADVRVVSPLPYVPPGPVPARYLAIREVPPEAEFDGIRVEYPRYPMIPKFGTRWQSAGYTRGIRDTVRRISREFGPHVLDTHYLYPDACGVSAVARELRLPFACSARGSDVHVLGRILFVRRRVRRALASAAAVIAVARTLAEAIRELGLFDGPIEVIPNGVDPARFHPRPRSEARDRLGLRGDRRHVVCVGHLVPVHGQDLLIEGLAHDSAPDDVDLHLVGDGPARAEYESVARRRGVASRVFFEGAVPHECVADWYCASDGSVQLSTSAGSPNAVLESLACGVPVLASDIPAMREALAHPGAGLCVPREVDAVASGLHQLVRMDRPSGAVRTWEGVAVEVLSVLERAVAGKRAS